MEVTPDQMSELDEEWMDEGTRDVSQNDGLLLCERKVYSLGDAVREENEAAVPDVVKSNSRRWSCVTHNRRFMSSGETPDSE